MVAPPFNRQNAKATHVTATRPLHSCIMRMLCCTVPCAGNAAGRAPCAPKRLQPSRNRTMADAPVPRAARRAVGAWRRGRCPPFGAIAHETVVGLAQVSHLPRTLRLSHTAAQRMSCASPVRAPSTPAKARVLRVDRTAWTHLRASSACERERRQVPHANLTRSG